MATSVGVASTANAVGLVQKEFSVAKRRFGMLVDSHDDCLDVVMAAALAPSALDVRHGRAQLQAAGLKAARVTPNVQSLFDQDSTSGTRRRRIGGLGSNQKTAVWSQPTASRNTLQNRTRDH